jgi:2-aminoethylphosphonate-pyruvate transaminase
LRRVPESAEAPRRAIILAAGLGMRLRAAVGDRPKGLIEIHGESLVGRSVRLLQACGVKEVTIVAGYLADQYKRFAATAPRVHVVCNEQFEKTGSMASLDLALERLAEPVLILESDIVYERRALERMLSAEAGDATLLSGPTGAGDEVWVDATGGVLRSMSKDREALERITGEFVGITRLSTAACAEMRQAFLRFAKEHGHGRMDYEIGALIEVARRRPVSGLLVPDLCWGEVDDDRQLDRVRHLIWPAL